jgi:glutamyl-tRNA(Gln) amidotransferase subunit D
MPRDPQVQSMLEAASITEGDLVEVLLRGRAAAGVLMPHSDFSDPRTLVLKLESGYNIGITVDAQSTIRRKEQRQAKSYAGADAAPGSQGGPLRGFLALIGTGGTIASYVDYETGAVQPALTSRELATAVPEVAARHLLKPVALFSEFSENLRPEHWVKIAHEVRHQIEEGATGVIIPHGTDTLAFTAAALSFMIGDPPVPVVLVGSQRSSDRPSSDASFNLLCAAKVAAGDIAEVLVVMHDRTGDERCAIHLGVRVRKMHSSARSAFRSINATPLGFTDGNTITLAQGAVFRKRSEGRKVALRDKLTEPVALLQHYPGFPTSLLKTAIADCKGVVIAGTGLGHVSEEMIGIIERACATGYPVVMTTQCLYGRTGLNVYSTGRKLVQAGVIDGGDTLPETAYVKLMWALAHAERPHDVKTLMRRNLAGELAERRTFEGSGEDEH